MSPLLLQGQKGKRGPGSCFAAQSPPERASVNLVRRKKSTTTLSFFFSRPHHPLFSTSTSFLKPAKPKTDYLTKVVVQGKQSSSLHVREIMTARSKLLTVPPQVSEEKRERERKGGF